MGSPERQQRKPTGTVESGIGSPAHMAELAARVEQVEAANAELRDALEAVAGDVCSLLCPSVWKTGEMPPHSKECQQVRAALAKAGRAQAGPLEPR